MGSSSGQQGGQRYRGWGLFIPEAFRSMQHGQVVAIGFRPAS